VASVTVERLRTPRGELVLRRSGEHCEIVSNGVFLMDTRGGRSERELVRAALGAATPGARLLIGGLGVGFSLAEAVRSPGVEHVTVVEIEPAVVRWHRSHLARWSADAMHDPRVEVVTADLGDWLRSAADRYDAICLDVDNGPEWTVTVDNEALYGKAGLDALAGRLVPDGTLAVWSSNAATAFEALLRSRFATVHTRLVSVARGEPDVVYVARRPRRRSPARPRRQG
jgi:spermidine synthase